VWVCTVTAVYWHDVFCLAGRAPPDPARGSAARRPGQPAHVGWNWPYRRRPGGFPQRGATR